MNTQTTSSLHVPFVKTESPSGFFRGYASVFNHLDYQGDRVIKGAFLNSLRSWREKGALPKMLWQHDPTKPIGQWLKIDEDQKGLYVEGQILLDLQLGREAYALIKAGVVDRLSIGYRVDQAKTNKVGERELTKLDLQEISLVTFAANSAACVLKQQEVESTISLQQRILSALQRAKQIIT